MFFGKNLKEDFREFWEFYNEVEKAAIDNCKWDDGKDKHTHDDLPLANKQMIAAYAAAMWAQDTVSRLASKMWDARYAREEAEEAEERLAECKRELSKTRRKLNAMKKRKAAKKSAKQKGGAK